MTIELLYFANPFCSWCWGFAPVVEAVRHQRPDLRLSLALGRLGMDGSKPLSTKARASIAEHWQHVTERSGQPFTHAVLQQPGLTYNTTLACQALMLVRQTYPALAPAFLARMAERFFVEGQDLTNPAILAASTAEFGLPGTEVEAALLGRHCADAMTIEWSQTERMGITGYPTLLALKSGKVEVITIGWTEADDILERLDRI